MRFKQFEIRECCFIGDPPTPDYHKWNFDLVKWDTTTFDGVKKNYCYSIGRLEWNRKESCFEFRSIGTRYLEYREEGLEKWLLKWCQLKEIEYRYEYEEE